MSFRAFLLYPGLPCMIGIIAILGALLELRLLHKDVHVKKRFGKFVFSTYWIALFSCFVIELSKITMHFLYVDDLTADRFIFAAVVTLAFVALRIALSALLKKIVKPCQEAENKKALKPLGVIGVILFIFGLAFFIVGYCAPRAWGGVRPEQSIVTLMSPNEGSEISSYLLGIEALILLVGFTVLFGIMVFSRVDVVIGSSEKTGAVLKRRAKTVLCFILSLIMFVPSAFYFSDRLSIPLLYKFLFVKSDFVEENYVDLRDVEVTFPEKKRNLIYIYLESYENSYLSKDLGGYMEENLMPELTELAYEGEIFSNTSGKFGGPTQIAGTEWSMASMINQTLGIPMKATMKYKAYVTPGRFLTGAYGLGDLLKENGYAQTFMVGATAKFAGVDSMYKTHGDFKIIDYDYAKETGMIPPKYKVWWGFEDDKLFSFAKDELISLSQGDKPFNLIIETIDTHASEGFLPDGAPTPYKSHYANSIAYNSRKVAEFVRWVQDQPFYENTTIIMIGDHHSMASAFFKTFDKNYLRTTFNLILNPAESVADTDESRFVNRKYSNMDMLPTTLAAIGCEIKGERAGLGTNLYSNEKTLLEIYGVEHVNDELEKHSDFYDDTLIGFD